MNRYVSSTIFFLLSAAFTLPCFAAEVTTSCPLKPEIHSELTEIWNSSLKEGIKRTLITRLSENDIYALYDVQKQTQNILRASAHCGNFLILEDIAGIYLKSLSKLGKIGSHRAWICSPELPGCPASLVGKENPLISAQFHSSVSYLLKSTLDLKSNPSFPNIRALHTTFPLLIREHLLKWALVTKQFSVAGWGCADKKPYTHADLVEKKRKFQLGKSPSHCNAITDTDLLIATTLVHYLELNSLNEKLFPISTDKEISKRFTKYSNRLLSTIRKRMDWAPGNGKNELRYVFDYGLWKEHPGMAAGGYSGEYTPITPAGVPTAQVLDQSHFTRMYHLLLAVKESKTITSKPPLKSIWGNGRTDKILTYFANQVSYTYAVDPHSNTPSLSNYIDGMIGWYRLNDSNIYGHPPSSLTMSSLTGGIGFLSSCEHFNPQAGSAQIQSITKQFLKRIEDYQTSNLSESERNDTKKILLTAQYGNVAESFATSTLASFYATLFCVE